jgi:hypothetical protein
LLKLLGRWCGAHALDALDRGCQRQIAARPGVGAPQDHQQVDVRGPRPNSLDRRQLDLHLVIIERLETRKIDAAVEDRLGDRAAIRGLLSAEADAL